MHSIQGSSVAQGLGSKTSHAWLLPLTAKTHDRWVEQKGAKTTTGLAALARWAFGGKYLLAILQYTCDCLFYISHSAIFEAIF